MPAESVASLIDLLQEHRLLEPAQLDELKRNLAGRITEQRDLVRQLVQRGWLTAYQGNLLLQGRAKELILEPYVLVERLGEGGMGQVFKARHQKLGRIVAIKVIRKERLEHPDAVRRFHREIRAAAQLDHPNIVHAYDADEVNGTHFFAMEYVEGIDLAKLVKQRGPLPVREACECIRQAALGLQHAHERGMVHRDIKPGNLLLTAPNRDRQGAGSAAGPALGGPLPHGRGSEVAVVKLLDMGLARLRAPGEDAGESASALTHQGTVMGTPDYIAPEQAISSHTVDIRADLYSLGCTLFFLLTGRPPFVGGTMMERLMKHQVEKPPPVKSLRPDVPPEVAAVVHKLLAKRPDERYQTPAELAAELQAVVENMDRAQMIVSVGEQSTSSASAVLEPTMALTGEPTPPVARPAPLAVSPGRGKLVVASVVSGMICLGLVLLVWWPFGRGKPPEVAASRPASITPAPRPSRPLSPEETVKLAEQKRVADAGDALKPLEAKFKEPGVTFETFAKEVQTFKATYGGTPAAIKAAEILMRLPSPLDQLDPAKIPEDAKAAWRAGGREPPVELVGVLGEHRGRHWSQVNGVAWSSNGKWIASGGVDGVVHLWDGETLYELATFGNPGNGMVRAVAFSPNSSLLTAASNSGFWVWSLETRKLMPGFQGHSSGVGSLAFSADSRRLLSGSGDKSLRLWDVSTGRELQRFEGHQGAVTCAALSPDGRSVLSGSQDRTMRLWDVDTGKELWPARQHTAPLSSVDFGPDGRHSLSATIGTHERFVRLWDTHDGNELRRFEHFPGVNGITSAKFSPKGDVLLAAAIGHERVRMWDFESSKEIRALEIRYVNSLAFSPDAKRAVTGSDDGTVRIWDVETGKEVRPLTGPVGALNTVQFSPDCGHLLTAGQDGKVRQWDIVSMVDSGLLAGHGAWYLPRGDRILASDSGNGLRLYDTGGNLIRGFGFGSSVVAIAANGKHALANKSGPTFGFIDLETGLEIDTFAVPGGGANTLDISPDGRRAVSGDGGQHLVLWDLQTRKELRRTLAGYGAIIHSARFSPDGRRVCFGSSCVGWWDLQTTDPSEHKIIHQREGNGGYIVELNPAGPLLAIARLDGLLTIRDVASGRKTAEWQLPGPIARIAFAADGRHLATANGNGTVYILRIAPPPPDPVAAEKTWKELQATVDAAVTGRLTPAARLAALREEVVKFRTKYAGLPQYTLRAAELLMKLPSPLDELDPAKIPEDAKAAWRAGGREPPVELVGVLGEHRQRHWGAVRSVAVSADGKWVASGGEDNVIRLWDAATMREHLVLRGHPHLVTSVAFHPDNRRLLSGGYNSPVRLWDITTGQELRRFESGYAGHVHAVAFSPDGRLVLAAAGDPVLNVWDCETGKSVARFENTSKVSFSFGTDGRRVISTQPGNTTRVWEVATGKELDGYKLPAGAAEMQALTFGPDVRTIVFGRAGRVTVFDLGQGKELHALEGHDTGLHTAAFSSDARRLVTGGVDKTFQVWDVQTGKRINRMEGHTASVNCAAFSPDGRHLVTGDDTGTVRLWDVETGKEVQPLTGHAGAVWAVAWNPDGKTLASGGQDGTVKLWDPAAGGELLTLKGHTNQVASVAFRPDGKALASASYDHTVKFWDPPAARELRTLKGHTYWVNSVAFSPDSKTLVSGSQDATLMLFDPDTGSEVHRLSGHSSYVHAVAFSPDGKTLASVSSDETVKLWDPAAGRELRTWKSSYAYSVAFSPDGKTLASGHIGSVKLWELGTGNELRTLNGHTGNVYAVAYSVDGKALATAGRDGRIILWDPASGAKLREWQLPGPVHAVTFAHDGRHLATANGNGTVYILRLPRGVDAAQLADGFTPLFNGKDLTGWKVLPSEQPDWTVRDGVLTSGGTKTPQYLFTERGDYKDFHLRAEVRLTKGGDSGVLIRAPFGDPAKARCYGVNLGPPHEFLSRGGAVPERQWPYTEPMPLDRWFQLDIVAREGRVAVMTDGRTVLDVTDPKPLLGPGYIALEQFTAGTKVEFRKIEIKESSAPLTPEGAKQQQADAAKALGVPVTIENSIGMKLNLIPAGRFLMGSPENEPGRQDHDGPQHEVKISNPFYMSVFEVPQRHYEKVMGKNPSDFRTDNGGGPDHPVEQVSWADAVAFCKKLSELPAEKEAGRTYRLPTEAEWEYACRAGTQTAYSFGDDARRLAEHAWIDENSTKTNPVGKLRPNAWGLFDMHGNVWEWCGDGRRQYATQAEQDPVGPAPADMFIIRGGCWRPGNAHGYCRSACRYFTATVANHAWGCRIVMEHKQD